MAQEFPRGFLWGTATAAHQVEGGNTASDLWLMEWMKDSVFAEPSGDACDHYHLYARDIALLKGLGFGVYRFSIEWARIEPEEGFFSRAALDHYRRMIACCLAADVIPMVTFHHFTAPLWFTRDGGWEDAEIRRPLRSLLRAGGQRAGRSHRLCLHHQRSQCAADGDADAGRQRTAARAAGAKRHSPKQRALSGGEPGRFAPYLSGDGRAATPNLIAAHRKGYEVLKPLVNGPVGITLALNDFQAEDGGEQLREAAEQVINRPVPGERPRRRFHRRADLHASSLRQERVSAAARGTPSARRWATNSIPRRWKPASARPPRSADAR